MICFTVPGYMLYQIIDISVICVFLPYNLRDQWHKDTYVFDHEMIQDLKVMIDTKGPYLCEL